VATLSQFQRVTYPAVSGWRLHPTPEAAVRAAQDHVEEWEQLCNDNFEEEDDEPDEEDLDVDG
jgi:hypothetical protein